MPVLFFVTRGPNLYYLLNLPETQYCRFFHTPHLYVLETKDEIRTAK